MELRDATGEVVLVAHEARKLVGDSTISAACYAPGTTLMATAHQNGEVNIWDLRGQHIIRKDLGHTNACTSLSCAPDGRHIASASFDSTVRIWDIRNGQPLQILRGPQEFVHDVCYSPDGSRLATASNDKTVRIWDARTGDAVLVLSGHESYVRGVSYAPDGLRLASAAIDNTVRLWDARSGRQLHVLRGHERYVNKVCYSPDGTRLASAAEDETVRVWSAHDGTSLQVLRGHIGPISWIAYAPDGSFLATASRSDQTVRLWDVAGHCFGALSGSGPIAWAPDSRSLALQARDGTLAIWTLEPPAAISAAPTRQSVSYIIRQARSVGRSVDEPAAPAEVWIPHLVGADGPRLGVLRHPVFSSGSTSALVELHPGGKVMFSAHIDSTVYAWDLKTGTRTRLHPESQSECWAMALSPDGRRLALATNYDTVRIHDIVEDSEVFALSGHPNVIGSLAFSRDGGSLASAAADNTVRVWNASTGELRYIHSNDSRVFSVNYSPDGARLACACEDGAIKLLDARDGFLLSTLLGHAKTVRCVDYSPDGRTLVSAGDDTTIRMWDAIDGTQLAVLRGHARAVMSVIHSPSGNRFASLSLDRTMRLWDPQTLECVSKVSASDYRSYWDGRTRNVIWAASGAYLALADFDGSIVLMDTRDSMPDRPPQAPPNTTSRPAPPPSPELMRLPGLAAALLRHRGHAPPLALLRDVLRSLQSHGVTGPGSELSDHTKLLSLQALHWPPDALAAVALWLCADTRDPAFAPPTGTTPADLESALTVALATGTPCPDEPVSPTLWPSVHAALDRLDPRSLIPLLHALGPAACAAQPHLLLALGDRLPSLVPLSDPARRTLATTTPLDRRDGLAHGPLGIVPAGTRPTGPPWTLRPWQWALPADAFACRRAQNRLSHTDRHGAEPPRLRPTVLILDDSLESLPVEQLLRAAALHLATSLVRAGVPAYLLTTAGHAAPLQHPSHLAELLAPIRRRPVDIPRLLARARDLARGLARAADDPPAIVLLTHVYFAADAPQPALPPDLRAIFVRYPRHHFTPTWLPRCRRHAVLGPTDLHRVPDALADLLR